MAKKKIGVMGGTFNPIHIGHLMLAEWAREEAKLDHILFMPAGCPYMKEGDFIASGEDRLNMVALAIQSREDFSVSGMEIERGGYTYTYETMEQLGGEQPEADFYFILGADCLYKLEYWKELQRLFNSCHILAAARNGSDLEEMEKICEKLREKYHARIELLAFPAIEISSSEIRQRITEQRSIRYLVPDAVREYITNRGLYEKY